MNMRYFFIILLSILLSTVSRSQVAIDSAADFTVKDLVGVQHHLYEYLDAGNYVIIDFFTTNCGPCQTYASEVSASYDHFGCNEGNVVFLGMNWGSDNQSVHLFDSLWGAMYPSVSGLQGGGNAIVDIYQVQSYPTVILIAPDRTILNNHIWPPETDTINAEVIAAGGIAQPCTVGTSQQDISSVPEIQANTTGHGSVQIRLKDVKAGMELKIFSSDGKLVQNETLAGKEDVIRLSQLKPGIYIAMLISSDGNRSASTKFMVN
jgi:thiol-disulfide isomerase/thioredoxin